MSAEPHLAARIEAALPTDARSLAFRLPFAPMGKPRMTQRDKWKKRPATTRYRKWKDQVALLAPKSKIPWARVFRIDWLAVLPMPASWSRAKRAELAGTIHQAKPDRDNIDKAFLDAVLTEDSIVAAGTMAKIWDDGEGPRLEVEVFWRAEEPKKGGRR